jgi:chromosome partitioning protein
MSGKAVVLSFASLKGGTGKTTLTLNLSHLWAGRGKKVLVVDFDPQANLTFSFLPPENIPEASQTRSLFLRRTPEPFQVSENLWLIGTDGRLSSWDLRGSSSDLLLPSQTLPLLPYDYDLILLDTPTGWRPLTKAALLASDYVVIPIDPSPFSVAGVVRMVESLVELSERHSRSVQILGVVVNIAEEHTRVTQRVIETVKQLVGDDRFLGVLSKSVKVKETVLERKPLHVIASGSKLSNQIIEISKNIERRVRRYEAKEG